MTAVTQLIPTYLGGVSKQIDSKKQPGQVRECLNAFPDPTFGLMKRPGTKFIETLLEHPQSDMANAKWFYIHRDGDEQYIGAIKAGSPGSIKIWNATSGLDCTITASAPHQNYLTAVGGAADKPDLNYDILTVQDTTFITNKTKVVTEQTAPTHTANKKATIRLLNVKYGSKYNVKIDGTETADLITVMEDAAGSTDVLNADDILDQLVTNIVALSGWSSTNVTRLPASIELTHTNAFTIEAIDGAGNDNLEVFQEQVTAVSELPSQSSHDRLVKVINTASDKDSYWVKFIATAGSGSGPGYWEETVDPTVSNGLDAATMPHELYNDSLDTFTFREIAWKDRLVGDDTTNEHPSFINKTIQQTFLYNTRLGFLTEDNVSISQAADWYNLYSTTALTSTAADPIDLNCSSVRPAVLHGVIPTAQGLILFSKNQQFIMFATEGVLTPATALIRSISNYEMDTDIDPVDVGTNINFVSKTPSYTRIFGMQTRGYEESPIIQDISMVVSQWIPEEIDSLLSSPQNSITGVYGKNSKNLYLYRVYSAGQEQMMQSWFRWEMPGNIQHCTIDNDIMWTVVESGGNFILLKSSISKSTSEDILVTNSGTQVNPHMDMFAYPEAAGKVTLVNNDKDTQIEIPYDDIPSLTPVILIKGSGVTDSGFTITPTRSGSGPYYFTVAGKDLETNTAHTDILVGYKYNYDIEIPKTYFRKQDSTVDYTANLTIARVKFAVGLSSVCSFKLKSKGFRGDLATFTGDGSTTTFTVPFPLKEENGIKVTLDGAVTTDYSVSTTDDQATVTFNTAPEKYTVYRLYGGSGYTAANGVATTSPNGSGLTVDTTVSSGAISGVTIHGGTGYVEGEIVSIAGGIGGGFIVGPAQKIEITTDTWYDVQPVQETNDYLADDVPLTEEHVFTLPIHQRTANFDLRVFSNSPFPVSLNSMMWEGNYSPRYYRRT